MIREIRVDDAAAICEIYNYYILHSVATFEEIPVTEAEMSARITQLTANSPWLVVEKDNKIIAYTYATAWRKRPAYRNTVESSIYLHPDVKSKGIGTQLYRHLLTILKEKGYRTVIGGTTLPNEASVRLHEKLGFKKVAHFKEVGYKFKQWLDVGYWQLLL